MNKTELTEEAREARNAYFRAYRAKHKEQVKQYRTNYWNKKALEMKGGEENENV